MQINSMIINGKAHEVAATFDVLNPANEELAGMAPKGGKADMDAAVAAARTAFESWSQIDDATRAKACHKIADLLESHSEELAQILTAEQGKPLGGLGSRFELGACVAWTRYNADLALDVEVLQDNDEGRIELHRKPIGVVGSITPWNWPLMIAIWHIIPAIRTGNTIVIKPSPFTPLSTLRMVEIINEALPAGVVNVVSGLDDLGPHLTSHPDIDKITFTGSTETGKHVMRNSVESLKRLTLELGGNDAAIVLPDANPKAIAEGLFWGAFINSGQTCACMKRLYVHDDIYEAVCEELTKFAQSIPVGPGSEERSILGPVQNANQYRKICDLVDDAKRQGGRVLLGGEADKGPGYFYPLTLIADMKNGMRLVDEEQFGPVLPIIRYTDIEETLQAANATDMGLGSSVWSADTARARTLAMRMQAGSAWVNSHGNLQPNVPFGGVKQSGFGVEFGIDGLKEFTTSQSVFCGK